MVTYITTCYYLIFFYSLIFPFIKQAQHFYGFTTQCCKSIHILKKCTVYYIDNRIMTQITKKDRDPEHVVKRSFPYIKTINNIKNLNIIHLNLIYNFYCNSIINSYFTILLLGNNIKAKRSTYVRFHIMC